MKRNFILLLFFLILIEVVGTIDSTVHTVVNWECTPAVLLRWEKPYEFEITTFRVIERFVVGCFEKHDMLPGFAKDLFLNELDYERS